MDGIRNPTDLIQRSALLRASRRIAAGTISLVAVLRDARNSALLWTRLTNGVDMIRTSDSLH
jgi:hypothetical protein